MKKVDETKATKIIELARRSGIIRPRDLIAQGVQRTYLSRLCNQGVLVRTGRGLYMLADSEISENHSLAEISKRVPSGVICLLSALRFHGITTQTPFEIWITIDVWARMPKVEGMKLRVVRFSGEALSAGIEEHLIENVPVRVYGPAKTVADCFKYRNKVGLDVALEALRECWRSRRCTSDELWHYAKICRIANVIRPYLESLV